MVGIIRTFLLFQISFILVEFERLLSEDELTGVVNEQFRPVLGQSVESSQFLLLFLLLGRFAVFFGIASFGRGGFGRRFLVAFKS